MDATEIGVFVLLLAAIVTALALIRSVRMELRFKRAHSSRPPIALPPDYCGGLWLLPQDVIIVRLPLNTLFQTGDECWVNERREMDFSTVRTSEHTKLLGHIYGATADHVLIRPYGHPEFSTKGPRGQ